MLNRGYLPPLTTGWDLDNYVDLAFGRPQRKDTEDAVRGLSFVRKCGKTIPIRSARVSCCATPIAFLGCEKRCHFISYKSSTAHSPSTIPERERRHAVLSRSSTRQAPNRAPHGKTRKEKNWLRVIAGNWKNSIFAFDKTIKIKLRSRGTRRSGAGQLSQRVPGTRHVMPPPRQPVWLVVVARCAKCGARELSVARGTVST